MKFNQEMKRSLMVCTVLTAFSAVAMDDDTGERAYKAAYAALDVLNKERELKVLHPQRSAYNCYIELQRLTEEEWLRFANLPPSQREMKLLAQVEENFEKAFEKGHPYAAAGLRHIYTTEAAEEILEIKLQESIERKRQKGITTGLNADIGYLKDILVKRGDFKKIEALSVEKAIRHYWETAIELTDQATEQALTHLYRLRDRPEAWVPLGEAFLKRISSTGSYNEKNHQESLKWFTKAIEARQDPSLLSDVLNIHLGTPFLPSFLKKDLTRLLHLQDLAQNKNDFSVHLNYYKLLRDAKTPEIEQLESLLKGIAERNYQERPQDLFDFCEEQATRLKEDTKYDTLAPLYLKAACFGSWDAARKIIDTPPLLKRIGFEKASILFLSYKAPSQGIEKIFEIYPEGEYDAFPVLFSFIFPSNQEIKKVVERLLQKNYPPALDLELYNRHETLHEAAAKELWIKKLKEEKENQKGSNAIRVDLQDLEPELFKYVHAENNRKGKFLEEFKSGDITLRYYNGFTGGIASMSLSPHVVQEHIEKLEKAQAAQREEVARLTTLKDQYITSLSDEGLYKLAQEYDFMGQALAFSLSAHRKLPSLFRENAQVLLKKAAERGYEPARQKLNTLTTPEAEKSDVYKKEFWIKKILSTF